MARWSRRGPNCRRDRNVSSSKACSERSRQKLSHETRSCGSRSEGSTIAPTRSTRRAVFRPASCTMPTGSLDHARALRRRGTASGRTRSPGCSLPTAVRAGSERNPHLQRRLGRVRLALSRKETPIVNRESCAPPPDETSKRVSEQVRSVGPSLHIYIHPVTCESRDLPHTADSREARACPIERIVGYT